MSDDLKFDAAAEILINVIKAAIAPFESRVGGLEARITALERQPKAIPAYRGVWREGETYHEGQLATFDGSLWWCKATTRQKPDQPDVGGRDWQLCVKRGRDGRDLRDT